MAISLRKRWAVTITLVVTVLVSCAKSDLELQQLASQKLASANITGVTVTVSNAVATLTGNVTDTDMRSRAEAAILSVDGIKLVTNNIVVTPPPPELTDTTGNVDEPSSLDDEAYQQAQKFADIYVVNCGGEYYFRTQSTARNCISCTSPHPDLIFECRSGPDIQITGEALERSSLSEADRLNGVDPLPIEWKGQATFQFSTCRTHDPRNTTDNAPGSMWSTWSDGSRFYIWLRKEHGNWLEGQDGIFWPGSEPRANFRITCSDIGKINHGADTAANSRNNTNEGSVSANATTTAANRAANTSMPASAIRYECNDGTYSNGGTTDAACAGHGGIKRKLK